MNRFVLTITALFVVFLLVGSVTAHAPSDLNLSYNQTTGNLSATFTHQVKDPVTHFLKEVKVAVNNNETILQNFTSQPTADIFMYEYQINASAKSVINVTGDCVLGGSLTKSLTV